MKLERAGREEWAGFTIEALGYTVNPSAAKKGGRTDTLPWRRTAPLMHRWVPSFRGGCRQAAWCPRSPKDSAREP